jgi:hypothetical protein
MVAGHFRNRRLQAIADARFGLQDAWPQRVGLDLLAQLAHQDAQIPDARKLTAVSAAARAGRSASHPGSPASTNARQP